MARKGYSVPEMRDIVEYIIEKNAYSEFRGKNLWTNYANSGKTTRTWQSLKEVFLKRILPDLRSPIFNLKPDILLNFQNSAYRADEMHADRRQVEWVQTNDAGPSSKTSKSEASTRSKSGSQKSSAGSQDPRIRKTPENDKTLENDTSVQLRSDSSTPDLQIDLSPPEQTMASNISNLNASDDLEGVISFVNHSCEDKATCPQCSIDVDADRTSVHSFDVVQMLECSGEESQRQTQSSIESELLPPNQEVQVGESQGKQAVSPAAAIRQRTLKKIKDLTKQLGEDVAPFLRRQPAQSRGKRQRDAESSDSSISEVLDQILSSERKAKTSRRSAKAEPKKRTPKSADKSPVVKKSPQRPKKSPKKITKSKSVSVAIQASPEVEKPPVSERRDVGIQANSAPEIETVVSKAATTVHNIDNLFGFASDLDEIVPHVETHLQSDVQAIEPPKEPPTPPRSRPQEKRISKDIDEGKEKKEKDKKRRKDLENLFGCSTGQVKVRSSRTDRPAEVTDKRRVSSDIEQQDLRASERNRRGSERSSDDEPRRNVRLNNKRRPLRLSGRRGSSCEKDLLAMCGGCLYPVYGGLPGDLHIVKWVPTFGSSKHRSRSRCSRSSTCSDSDREASTSAVQQKRRSPVKSAAASVPVAEKDFATAEMEKQYCQAVLRYYKNDRKGPPPKKSDYQNVHKASSNRKQVDSKRNQYVNFLDSDEEPGRDVIEDVGEKHDGPQNDIPGPANGIKDCVKKLSNMDPTDDNTFWKTVSDMIERKIHNDRNNDDVVSTRPDESVEMPKQNSDGGCPISKQNAKGWSKKRCTASDIPPIVIEAPLFDEIEEVALLEKKDKDVSKTKKLRMSTEKKKSAPKRSPTRAKNQANIREISPVIASVADGENGQADQEINKDASKAPKFSVTIQKYGEDMANYVIENTQATDLFISAMDNLKNALKDGSSKTKEPAVVDHQQPSSTIEPEGSPASEKTEQQVIEMVDLTTDSLTPTMQSVWDKERPIFEAIARADLEDMMTSLSKTANAEIDNHAIDNIAANAKPDTKTKDQTDQAISDGNATKAKPNTNTKDQTNQANSDVNAANAKPNTKTKDQTDQANRDVNATNAKTNTKTKDQTDQAISDINAANSKRQTKTKDQIDQKNSGINAASEERRSTRKRPANTRLSQRRSNRGRKSVIKTMAETEFAAKEMDSAVASSSKPTVPDDTEVSSDGPKISKVVNGLDNQNPTSLQFVSKEQLEATKATEVKVTSADGTGDSKQPTEPESQSAVGEEEKESIKKVSPKSPQSKGPQGKASPRKRTKSEAEGASRHKSSREGHMTRATTRAVKDDSKIGTRGRVQNGDNEECGGQQYAEVPILNNFKSLHESAPAFFGNFHFPTSDDRNSEVYETMAEIRVPKDGLRNTGSPVSYTSETDMESRECFEACHISTRRGSSSDVIDSFDRLVLQGFEPEVTDDLSSEDQRPKSALKSKSFDDLKKKRVSFKQIDTITEETIIIEPINGIQDAELLEALSAIRGHAVASEVIYVLDTDEDPDATVIIQQTKPVITSHKEVITASSSDSVAGKIPAFLCTEGDNQKIIESLPDDENDSDFFTPSAMSSVEKISEKSSNTPFYSPMSSPPLKIESVSPENVKPSLQTSKISTHHKTSNWYLFSTDDSQDSPISKICEDQPIQDYKVVIKNEEHLNNNMEINSCRNCNET